MSPASPQVVAIDKAVRVQMTPALLAFLRVAADGPGAASLEADWLAEIRAALLLSASADQSASGEGGGAASVRFALIKSVRDRLLSVASVSPPPPPLWRLLSGGGLALPPPPSPPQNPELTARLARLRAEQEQREYDRMTADLRTTPLGKRRRGGGEQDSLGGQLRSVNRQLATVLNFLLTVGAAFAFGYKACEYAAAPSHAPLAAKISLGLILATIVFFADLYFVVKLDYLTGKPRSA